MSKGHGLWRWIANLVVAVLVLAAPVMGQAQDSAPVETQAEPPLYPPALAEQPADPDLMVLRLLPLTVDQLDALADVWLSHARDAVTGVTDLRIAMRQTEDADEQARIRSEMTAALSERSRVFANLNAVVDAYAAKGGDQARVDQLRAYRTAVVAVEAQRTDWRTLGGIGIAWLTDWNGGLAFVWQVGVFAGALFVLLFVARIIRGGAHKGLSRVPSMSKLLLAFITGAVYWVVLAVGLMVVLAALGVNVTPVFALFGGAAFILAFAMQETLGNLAAGVMIILNRPFDEGDYVTVAGVGGTVKTVSIVSTTVTTPDNQVIVIPNGKVWGDIITNVTASTTRRVDMVFGIAYSDSIALAQEVLERVVTAHPLVLRDPVPVIRVNQLADSSVNFIVRPWVLRSDYWTVYWDLMRQVKEAFDAEGLSIPFPQTDMHLHVAQAAPLLTASAATDGAGQGRPRGAPDFRSGDGGE